MCAVRLQCITVSGERGLRWLRLLRLALIPRTACCAGRRRWPQLPAPRRRTHPLFPAQMIGIFAGKLRYAGGGPVLRVVASLTGVAEPVSSMPG